ncbi:MAG TPA: hypothetical protein VFB74_33890 [Kribbellaceae bacterium]|nr:hypothetical protein [Kribbellaceae bacterium]
MSAVQTVELALFVVALAALVTFVAVYARRTWYRSAAGRAMMAMNAGWLLFALALAGSGWFELPGAVWILILGTLDVALWGQVVLLVRAGRAGAVRSADGRKD